MLGNCQLLEFFKNSGGTLALEARLSVHIKFKPVGEGVVIPTEMPESSMQGPFALAPNQTVELPVAYIPLFTQQQMDNLQAGYRLLIFGRIAFQDIFGSPKQEIAYTARYIAWEKPRPQGIADFWILNNFDPKRRLAGKSR